MTPPERGDTSIGALKARIEAADRAAARGAPGEALRVLVDGLPSAIAPDHDHTCPECGQPWSHLDEPCGDLTSPMLCGWCEDETGKSDGGSWRRASPDVRADGSALST